MSLKKQTISGVIWTFSQQFSVQAINFVVQIVLARILTPAEFGLIGMLTVFMAIGNSLADSGLTSSLIRTENPDQKDYSTVFLINVFISIGIYVALFFAAPFVADFYHQPLLSAVMRVYVLSFVIRAFATVQTTRLTKEMNFKLQMTMQIPSVVIGGIIGIVLAYMGYGVWSLVWMNLIQTFLFTVQHWIRTGWYPHLKMDKERLAYHFKFGYKLTLSGLINTLFTNIYTIVIGRYFSATVLGYYTRAQTLQMFPVQNISNALNKVTYPMFASIKDDDIRLKSVYKRLMQQVLFWVAPVMVGLIVTAEPLFRLVLTEKWIPAVPYFQILCISGILYPLQAYNLNILNVKGRSDLFLRIEITKKFFTLVGIFFIATFGIYGLLYFRAVNSVTSFYINSQHSGKMINYSTKEQLLDITPILVVSAVAGFADWGLDWWIFSHYTDWLRILVSGGVFMVLYIGCSMLFKISAISDFKSLILKRAI